MEKHEGKGTWNSGLQYHHTRKKSKTAYSLKTPKHSEVASGKLHRKETKPSQKLGLKIHRTARPGFNEG